MKICRKGGFVDIERWSIFAELDLMVDARVFIVSVAVTGFYNYRIEEWR